MASCGGSSFRYSVLPGGRLPAGVVDRGDPHVVGVLDVEDRLREPLAEEALPVSAGVWGEGLGLLADHLGGRDHRLLELVAQSVLQPVVMGDRVLDLCRSEGMQEDRLHCRLSLSLRKNSSAGM